MGYLVTIDPHLLSSPHVQPVLFFILSSLPLLWYFLAFYLFLRCLLMSTPLSLWIEGFSFCLFFHLHVLLFSFISSFFSPPGSRSMVFVFIFSLLSVWCLLLCLHHLSPFLSLPFILFTSPLLLGFSSLSRCFHIHTPFSLSLCLSLFSPLFSSILLFPLSSHFHATHWAATLSVFISVCGRGGSPVPATNGLLENTDSHASQSGELHREKEKEDLEWSQRESDLGQRRKQTNEGKSDSEEKN